MLYIIHIIIAFSSKEQQNIYFVRLCFFLFYFTHTHLIISWSIWWSTKKGIRKMKNLTYLFLLLVGCCFLWCFLMVGWLTLQKPKPKKILFFYKIFFILFKHDDGRWSFCFLLSMNDNDNNSFIQLHGWLRILVCLLLHRNKTTKKKKKKAKIKQEIWITNNQKQVEKNEFFNWSLHIK